MVTSSTPAQYPSIEDEHASAETKPNRRPTRLLWTVVVLASFAALAIALRIRFLSGLGWLILITTVLGLLAWVLLRSGRRLLWRVGRRLLVSYVLIGVLPIPIVLGIAIVGAFIAGGFFLAHVGNTALDALGAEARAAAVGAAATGAAPDLVPEAADRPAIAYALYRDGTFVEGDPRAPLHFPSWLGPTDPDRLAGEPTVVVLDDGTRTIAAAASRSGVGALAFVDSDLEQALRRKTGIWVELVGTNDSAGGTTVNIGRNRWVLTSLRRSRTGQEILTYFERQGYGNGALLRGIGSLGSIYPLHQPTTEAASSATDDPTATADETSASAEDISASAEDISASAEDISATYFAPRGLILEELFSGSSEIDTLAWLAFVLPAFLLMDIYVLAAIMAGAVVLRVSRAVNQLSAATAQVQSGDFSARIPVKRADQIGALQTSFNEMAANLERLVEQAASQEIVHKELEIAHDLQRSLLPTDLSSLEAVEVATFFEPSAAIGGDYFDVFALDEGPRIAVVVADVAGHGLSAGLHMAMFKAALDTLVYEGKSPELILQTLDGVVRTMRAERRLITATLALLDPQTGILDLTNAGHPPTYHLRSGSVREVALPSPPLGALGTTYGRSRLDLLPGDVVVWLSDGFVEACDAGAESFGYDRIVASLEGDAASASRVRDRLLAAVKRHTGAEQIADDRTVVVLRYDGAPIDLA